MSILLSPFPDEAGMHDSQPEEGSHFPDCVSTLTPLADALQINGRIDHLLPDEHGSTQAVCSVKLSPPPASDTPWPRSSFSLHETALPELDLLVRSACETAAPAIQADRDVPSLTLSSRGLRNSCASGMPDKRSSVVEPMPARCVACRMAVGVRSSSAVRYAVR